MSATKLIFVLFFLLFGIQCSNKSGDPNQPSSSFKTQEVLGSWDIVPSDSKKIRFETDGKVYLHENGGMQAIHLIVDSKGAKLFMNKGDKYPRGYFLFSQKINNNWSGIWDEEVVKLSRDGQKVQNRSILE